MYEQTRSAWVSNAFCLFLIWVAFWHNANHIWLTVWTCLCVLIMVLREIQSRRYASLAGETINPAAWTRWLELSLFLNGCLWGIGCAALTMIATPYQLTVILLISGGLQSGSVLASSYVLNAFMLFSLPLFLCTFAAFLTLGFREHPSLLVTAALFAVLCLFNFVCASRFGKHYRRSVGYALEKFDLAESLKTKFQENNELNQTLHDRIEELNITQRQLLSEKDRSDGLVEQLRKLSLTDGLTGLGNRRCFDENLQREWRRAVRNGQPLVLVLADVDHFKAYNDRYGHQMGDECLVSVARVLSNAVRREGDWATRYGGEEFALIFANTSLKDAATLAERVRENLINSAIEHDSSPTAPHVTLSLGVAGMIPGVSVEPDALLAAADEALYSAKQTGRNQVVEKTVTNGPRSLSARG